MHSALSERIDTLHNNRGLSNANFHIRELTTEAELVAFIRIADLAFSDEEKSEPEIDSWLAYLTTSPDVLAGSVRGAFDNNTGEVLGGYVLHRRQLCIGSARLPTGCIGGVVTAPNQRKRGIASALMRDAIDYAQHDKLALLFLTGIPHFYDRFGYVAVREEVELHLEREAIRTLTPSAGLEVRPARPDDAAAWLTLYQTHFQPYVGSFERDLLSQRQQLDHALFNSHYNHSVACDGTGRVRGYLLLKQKDYAQVEIAADDWPAIAALLSFHERLVASDTTHLTWRLPLDSPIFYHLMERIPARSERWHHFSGDWMARPGHVETLVRSLLPAWTERLHRAMYPWQGNLILWVDTLRLPLTISTHGVTLGTQIVEDCVDIRVTAKALTQLCFGFRPVSWFASQPDHQIPPQVQPLLEILFPPLAAWVAGSDYF